MSNWRDAFIVSEFNDVKNFFDAMPIFASSVLREEMMRDLILAIQEYQTGDSAREIRPDFDIKAHGINDVACIEMRGFLPGLPLADRFGLDLLPIRKAGKLPGGVIRKEASTEYSNTALEIQLNLVHPGHNYIVMDDVLATGGSMVAAIKLINQAGGHVSLAVVLGELPMGGRERLEAMGVHVISLCLLEGEPEDNDAADAT